MKIKLLSQNAIPPKRIKCGDAGYDLAIPEDFKVMPGRNKIGLAFAMQLDYGKEAQIRPRSGFSLKGTEGYPLHQPSPSDSPNPSNPSDSTTPSSPSDSPAAPIPDCGPIEMRTPPSPLDCGSNVGQASKPAASPLDCGLNEMRATSPAPEIPDSNEKSRFDADVLLGTVDCNYRGEVSVILKSLEKEPFLIKRGTRVAQMVIAAYSDEPVEITDSLSDSDRGTSGFGASGTI